jgi:PAS domain S-box-containing protein
MKAVTDQVATAMERMRTEEALRQARDELEMRVRERTIQLTDTIKELKEEVGRRTAAEQTVRERSGMLDALFEHTITPLVILDRDFNFIRVNEAYARACRRSIEDFPGHNHFEFYPHAENEEIFANVMRTQTPYVAVAKPFSFPDHPEWGVTYWDWTLVPLFNDADEVEYLVFALEDVTQRKLAEIRSNVTNILLELFAKKTSRKEYLDSVVRVISDWSGCRCVGIRLLNSEGYIPYAAYVGFPEEFLKQENMLSIETDACACIRVITGEAKPPDAAAMTATGSFCLNNSFKFLHSLTEKGKKLFRGNCIRRGYASIAVVPVHYREKIIGAIHLADEKENKVPAQNVEFLENIALLIGEAVYRFDTEDELRESEERYRQLVEMSPDGIGVEIDGKIAFLNSAGAKLLGGIAPEEFIGRPIGDFVHPNLIKRVQKQLKYLRKKWKILPLREAKILRVDGTAFDVEAAATPFVYQNRPAAQIVFRDITERKAAEEKILTDQEILRSLTAELVLTEERERHTVATALHDSLGPILAFSKRELGILQKSLPAKAADTLRNISENISEAIEQTRSLTFDLSPPALYTFGFEIATAELVERFCEDKKLKIVFENSDEPKPLADPVKILLYRSVRELLINIAKHAHANVVSVALSKDDSNIKIVVEDDGKGFNISCLGGKSTGFGLFSVRERITHIGGKFDIQSAKNKGTRVTLLAPLELNGVSHPLRENE